MFSLELSVLGKKPVVFQRDEKVVVIKRLDDLGHLPTTLICPFCEEKTVTDCKYAVGGGTCAYCCGITAIG